MNSFNKATKEYDQEQKTKYSFYYLVSNNEKKKVYRRKKINEKNYRAFLIEYYDRASLI